MDADYAEIRRLAKGPGIETDLTLCVTFTFSEAAVDAFKTIIPWHDRTWRAPEKCWYAHPRHLEAIKAFARNFDGAMFIDGERWEDLRTGRVLVQGRLFEDNANA